MAKPIFVGRGHHAAPTGLGKTRDSERGLASFPGRVRTKVRTTDPGAAGWFPSFPVPPGPLPGFPGLVSWVSQVQPGSLFRAHPHVFNGFSGSERRKKSHSTLPAGRTTPAGANGTLRPYSICKDQSGIGLHRLTLTRPELRLGTIFEAKTSIRLEDTRSWSRV